MPMKIKENKKLSKAYYKLTRMNPGKDPKVIQRDHAEKIIENHKVKQEKRRRESLGTPAIPTFRPQNPLSGDVHYY